MLYPSYILTCTSRTSTPTQELEGLSSRLSWDQKDLSTIFSRVLKQQMIVQERLGEKRKWKLFLFGNCSTLLWIINLLLSQSKGTMIIPNSAIKELSFLRWALVPVPIPANAVSIKYLASSHKWQPNRSVERYILERVCDSVVACLNLLVWPFVAKLMTWPLWTQVERCCISRRLFPLPSDPKRGSASLTICGAFRTAPGVYEKPEHDIRLLVEFKLFQCVSSFLLFTSLLSL